jgi:hypothetical protein
MATAVTGVNPSCRTRSSSTGTNAMSSSCICIMMPPRLNATLATGITRMPRPFSRRARPFTSRPNVPVRSTTVNPPPMRNTSPMTEAASTMPFGIATIAWKGPTGWGSTLA